MQQGNLGSAGEWALLFGLCIVVAVGATILWAIGYEFLWFIPFIVGGIMLSACFGYGSIRVFGPGWRYFIALSVGWILIISMYFVLPFEWLFAGSSFTEEGDNTWIYWLLQGTFIGLVGSTAMLVSLLRQGSATPAEIRKRRREGRRSLMILGGVVGGVFALLFLVYVFLEYLLAPIVRYFN